MASNVKKMNISPTKNWLWGIAVIVVLFIGYIFIGGIIAKGGEIEQSRFLKGVKEQRYEKITDYGTYVVGEIKDENKREFTNYTGNLTDILKNNEIKESDLTNFEVKGPAAITVQDILSFVLLSIGLYLVYTMVRSMQSSGGRLMDFGQSKAKLVFGKKTGTHFADVAGIDEVKDELVEIVDFLKNPKKYHDIGARIPRGVLLVGQPGTGKTLLAKAVAGEAGVPFFHTSGSEFEEMLVGAGASRVRDLFTKAKRAAPCIIFIDEIDAVAKKRGTVLHTGSAEQTLNQILVEMDGIEERQNVIVLAATNRPDVLDPAILRPGRFDRSVVVQMPDLQGRIEILAVHARNKKLAEDADLSMIAKRTVGYSGADLENLLNEAAIKAAREGRKELNRGDLLEAYLKVKLGRERKNKREDDTLERVAYHEAGHAIVAKFTPEAHPVERVSITSRGMSGGVTVYTPEKETTLMKKSQLIASITTAVAGKIAEEEFLKEMSSGGASDIRHATELAKTMIKQYGMSDKLGFVQYGNNEETNFMGYQYGGDRDYSDRTAEMIDEEIKGIIDQAQNSAREILKTQSAKVKELVKILLEKENVEREEFEQMFA